MKPLARLMPLLSLLGVLAFSPAYAAQTPAGTQITNQARADFQPPLPGEPNQAFSNVVHTVVQAVCSVSVAPNGSVSQPGQSMTLLPGEQATFKYSVVNTGNTTETFPLTTRVEAGSGLAPGLKLILDQNGNGQADAAEPEISSVALKPDESALVLLLADTPNTSGDAYVNVLASCADGSNPDQNNVSVVRVGPPPVLGVQKTFTPSLLRPGAQTTVDIVTSNTGQGESRAVTLTDPLADELAQGLSYVPGSASTNLGTLEYTQDGSNWSSSEVIPVRGVRVRVSSLRPGESLRLSFRMQASASAEGKVIPNLATAQSGAQTVQGEASVDVRYLPGVAIGPVGNPEAPEGSNADQQHKLLAVTGTASCFDHTIKNTGDVQDDFQIQVSYPQGTASAALLGQDGQPLKQPLTLAPGQTAFVQVCYTATQTGPLEALITVQGARGTSNATRDLIDQVEGSLPELKKTFVATTVNAQGQTVRIPEGGTVSQGNTITYNLTVHNPYARPLTNVVITDPLPAHLDFVSASLGGKVSGQSGAQTVIWNLGTLAGGDTLTLSIVTTVSARATDGEALQNTFGLVSSEFPTLLPSNTVQTPVWSAKLDIKKTVSKAEVTAGDRVTYTLTITNQSATTAIVDADVTDTPDAALQYIAGTSLLGSQPLADPQLGSGQLHWTVPHIPAGGVVTIKYDMRVLPQASGQLLNEVKVVGTGAGGVARAIASNRATATTRLQPLGFAAQADILGVVFVDRNRNGLFDPLLDTPVPRARVLLAGGRQVITDAQGRYSFPNVSYGTWALRLDPNTTPYPPLHVAQDSGLSGTQTVNVKGLTSVDFPLAPLGGDIAAMRRTTLVMGDVRVEKAVYAVENGYVVTLKITTPTALSGVQLLDPLPDKAALKEGRNTFTGSLAAGETYLTYRFDWTGTPDAATTDPVLSWRY